jgi:hypothetical protein
MIPLKFSPSPTGMETATARVWRVFCTSSTVLRKSARSRSSLLTKTMRGISNSCAHCQILALWALTPSTAETTRTAPPRMRRQLRVSCRKLV